MKERAGPGGLEYSAELLPGCNHTGGPVHVGMVDEAAACQQSVFLLMTGLDLGSRSVPQNPYQAAVTQAGRCTWALWTRRRRASRASSCR